MQRLKSHEGGEQYLNSDLKGIIFMFKTKRKGFGLKQVFKAIFFYEIEGPLIKWNLLQTLSPNNYAVKFDVMNCYERRQEEHDLRVKTIKVCCA